MSEPQNRCALFVAKRAFSFAFKKFKGRVVLKKIVAFLLFALIVFGSVFSVSFAVSEPCSYLTSSSTPTSSATLKFSKKFGNGYMASPTTPVAVGNTLIVASGKKLYKLDAQTGKEIKSAVLSGSLGFGVATPLYADGKVFVQLDGGKIQAFDYKTMKSLWLYTDPLGGQSISPITYDKGYIYTGFWNGEDENANFVSLNVKDEQPKKETEAKKARWKYTVKGGFYWAGATVTEGFVVVGTDDGTKGENGNSKILALKKSNGKLASYLKTKGDIRSSVTFDESLKVFFASSKAGFVYRFKLREKDGKLYSLSSFKAAGNVTSSPVSFRGRLYFACRDGKKGKFVVLDSSSMKKIYDCEMLGYSQSTALVCTKYDNKVYIYMTYNEKPGGITVFEDSENQKTAKKTELFKPAGEMGQYCISSVTAGSDGTIYYKNDSGYVFALYQNPSLFVRLINSFLRTLLNLLSGVLK